MTQIDWSKAPAEATHCTPGDQLITRTVFWRVVDGIALEAWALSNDRGITDHFTYGKDGCSGFARDFAVVRPNQPWTGAGLPPVGIECEVTESEYRHPFTKQFSGKRVTIVAHAEERGDPVAVFRVSGLLDDHEARYHALIAGCFRPIRTPEQIAAEEREKAVLDMVAIVASSAKSSSFADTMRALYDAGFRKVEGGEA